MFFLERTDRFLKVSSGLLGFDLKIVGSILLVPFWMLEGFQAGESV